MTWNDGNDVERNDVNVNVERELRETIQLNEGLTGELDCRQLKRNGGRSGVQCGVV
jgi:hypothetical protein